MVSLGAERRGRGDRESELECRPTLCKPCRNFRRLWFNVSPTVPSMLVSMRIPPERGRVVFQPTNAVFLGVEDLWVQRLVAVLLMPLPVGHGGGLAAGLLTWSMCVRAWLSRESTKVYRGGKLKDAVLSEG